MQQLYITRRNLLTLLKKLDRVKHGGASELTIIKQDTIHPKYPCSDVIAVTAVEDDAYYTERQPGRMLPEDEPNV